MWNLTLQRELPGGYIVSAGYVGRRGESLYGNWDDNQIDSAPRLPSLLGMTTNTAIHRAVRMARPNGNPCTRTVAHCR